MAKSKRGSAPSRSRSARRKSARGAGSKSRGSTQPRSGRTPDSGLISTLTAAAGPEELLAALQGTDDPFALLDQLDLAGLMPSLDETFGHVLDSWTPLLAPGSNPLEAELKAAEFLGTMRRMTLDGLTLNDLPAAAISQAEAQRTPEAMAMLTALAVVGPPEVRSAAADAAARLAAAGLAAAPRWAAEIGRPSVGMCFGYVDAVCEQEAVALCFRYGRKQHAVNVLIDHALGGGVKDCFSASRVRLVRAHYLASARHPGHEFRELSPADAASIVARSLDREPCPEEPDQIEDVDTYLGLVRARVELLLPADPGGRAGEPPATPAGQGAHEGLTVPRVSPGLRARGRR
jgi:hypothetical protein